MAELDFYPIDVSYRVERAGAAMPVIELYGRRAEGSQVLEQVRMGYHGFLPYFWVLPSSDASECAKRLAGLRPSNPEFSIVSVDIHDRNYLGRPVRAVRMAVNIPAAVPDFREKARAFGIVLEADIPFARRFLIDKRVLPLALYRASSDEAPKPEYRVPSFRTESLSQIDDGMHELRVLAIDIETHNPLGKAVLPEEHPIIMAALCGDGFRKVITWKEFPNGLDYLEFVGSEVELLERLQHYISQYAPDVITGYFSDVFDFPYIKARADRYKLKFGIGLDGSGMRISKTAANTTTEITGIVHLDIFKFIRKVMWTSLQTTVYDLDSVARELLNESKDDVEIDKLYLAWDSHSPELEKYCAYNMQDAQLVFRLCSKVLPNVMELTRTIGLPLFDVSRMTYSQLVEWYLLRQAPDFSELAPNRPSPGEEAERRAVSYAGGFVYEPVPGLYRDVVVFDFMSLYPTVISAHNISPDTLKCECCRKDDAVPGEQGIWFCKKKRGFIPSVIDEVIKRRMRVKEIIKATGSDKTLNARQMALKTIANSMYGYLGFFGARWYSLECAKAITAFGRNHIQDVIAQAKGRGFRVLYSDTDSIFMALDGRTRDEVTGFVADVNKSLPGMMELDYEGFYPSGIFVGTKGTGQGAKKKYALLSESGKIKIRGFETVRRNLSIVAKKTQERVLDIILRDHSPEAAFEYVRNVVSDTRARKLPAGSVIITTQLQKDIGSYESFGPHVAAAQRMKDKGLTAVPGSIIKYVVVQGPDRIRDRVRLPGEVREGEYDPEYYVNNQIVPAVGKILELFGYSQEDLAAEKSQKKLQAWFG